MNVLSEMHPAFLAYIDPGTGTFILQMVMAGVVGVGLFFRNAFFKIFRRNKKDGDSEQSGPLKP
jgi:hypothetical protein